MWGEEEAAAQRCSREAALALEPKGSGKPAAGPGWRHACHVLLYARSPAASPGPAVLMQLRFDGRFGFPGGLVEPGRESLEAGLRRELREELGPAAAALRFRPRHHGGARVWPAGDGGSGSDVGLVTHFYIRRLRWEELVAIERGGPRAAEHGLEVQGLVRVPLGRGLPAFLRHRFAGDARQQLLGALPTLGIRPPPRCPSPPSASDPPRPSPEEEPAGTPPKPGGLGNPSPQK